MTDDRYWCSEGCGFVDEHHRCEQWTILARIPAEAIERLQAEEAKRNVLDLEARARDRLRSCEEHRKAWLRAHPLTEHQQDRLIEHIRSGGALCCDDGRDYLRRVIGDTMWADHLNEWAYEALGCGHHTGDEANRYAERLAAHFTVLRRGGE